MCLYLQSLLKRVITFYSLFVRCILYRAHLLQFVTSRHMVINELLRCRKVEQGHQIQGRP